MNKRILVDFDGVLMQRGKQNHERPIPGAIKAMRNLASLGYDLVIHSSRAGHNAGRWFIRRWLDKHDIPCERITHYKLDATHYIDDKAIPFNGSWVDAMQMLSSKDSEHTLTNES